MPTAYLTTKGMKVSVTSERLEIVYPPDYGGEEILPQRRHIPLMDVEYVIVDSGIHFSTYSLCQLLRRNIPVLFLQHRYLPAGWAVPLNRFQSIKAWQLDACRNPEKRLEFARSLIVAKIKNQRRTIQRLAANRKTTPVAISFLTSMANQAKAAASLDALRGIEGAAAGRYFETYGSFFPVELPFETRTRRPPKNAVNAILSFAYTLLAAELSVHLQAIGLEPSWGLFHENEDGRPSLALDLLEPFRAPIADALCLDLVSHRQFTAANFEERDGGVFLRRTSRRPFFVALEKRLEREFFSEQKGHRTCLRQQMKDLCANTKTYLQDQGDFMPFLMN